MRRSWATMARRSLSSSTTQPKIAVAMSGGVDSSVVAYLLQQQLQVQQNSSSVELLGVHMANWNYNVEDTDEAGATCWEADWKDAKAVAGHLKIPLVHTTFEQDYWNSVFEPYVDKIAKHQTPNPDVDCNRYIKFGVLKEYLWSRYQIDTLATGHYARLWDPHAPGVAPLISVPTKPATPSTAYMPECLQVALEQDPSIESLLDLSSQTPTLLAARDATKDQSYFLTGVDGRALHKTLFPLGDLLKRRKQPNSTAKDDEIPSSDRTVREWALHAQLPNATKRDSMGICFVGKRKHGAFVQDFLEGPETSSSSSSATTKHTGQCLNIEDGSLVATFDPIKQPSLTYATIGQGAKLGGSSQKWFVVDKEESNDSTTTTTTKLWICPGTHHPALYADRFFLPHLHFIGGKPPPPASFPLKAQCRIRHLQPLVDCEILPRKDSSGGYEVITSVPLRGIALGQVCAIYLKGIVCLGGGPIGERGPTYWDLQKTLPSLLHPAGSNDTSVVRSPT